MDKKGKFSAKGKPGNLTETREQKSEKKIPSLESVRSWKTRRHGRPESKGSSEGRPQSLTWQVGRFEGRSL